MLEIKSIERKCNFILINGLKINHFISGIKKKLSSARTDQFLVSTFFQQLLNLLLLFVHLSGQPRSARHEVRRKLAQSCTCALQHGTPSHPRDPTQHAPAAKMCTHPHEGLQTHFTHDRPHGDGLLLDIGRRTLDSAETNPHNPVHVVI